MANICSVVLNSVSSDTRVLKQAHALARAGRQVTIVGVAEPGQDQSREVLANGVTIRRCAYPLSAPHGGAARRLTALGRKARGMLAMFQAIRRARPRILHCHDVYTLPLGAAARGLLSCRVVYDAHEIYEEAADAGPAQARRFGRIHRACAWACDGFVTINPSIAAWYAENHPRLPPAVVVMNAAPALPAIRYDGRLHHAAGLPPEVKILLFQGGLKAMRGLEEVAAAAGHLPPPWAVVMMGHGELREPLARTARDLAKKIGRPHPPLTLTPPAPLAELPLWTAGAAVGLIPYLKRGLNHWYCTPNKLWEYPSAGVPVLASPFPEMMKLIQAHGFGWALAPDWKAESLAAQVLFVPTELAVKNLAREGIAGEKVRLVGDVMYDAALFYGQKAERQSGILDQLGLSKGNYLLATVHRPENTDDPRRLAGIMRAFEQIAGEIPVVFPVHPRTRQKLGKDGLQPAGSAALRPGAPCLIQPVGYLDMVMLEKNAAVIATDSGGVQREAFFHRVPCVILRQETEWVELVELGWSRLARALDPADVTAKIEQARAATPGRSASPYGQGDSAQKIARFFQERG